MKLSRVSSRHLLEERKLPSARCLRGAAIQMLQHSQQPMLIPASDTRAWVPPSSPPKPCTSRISLRFRCLPAKSSRLSASEIYHRSSSWPSASAWRKSLLSLRSPTQARRTAAVTGTVECLAVAKFAATAVEGVVGNESFKSSSGEVAIYPSLSLPIFQPSS